MRALLRPCSGVDRFCALQIITPVVERSVTIACMTTQELVVKDFALEPDDNTLRQVGFMLSRTTGRWYCVDRAISVNDVSCTAGRQASMAGA